MKAGTQTVYFLVDESGIIRQSEIQEIRHPSPPVSISCHDAIINNTVRQQHTFSPVNNGDGYALELRSALCKVRRADNGEVIKDTE